MKSSSLIVMFSLITFIMISGCFDDGFLFDEPKYSNRETFDYEDSGTGHLEETESEMVFKMDLEEGEYLSHFSCLVSWKDEAPVERMREYYNEGDEFLVSISDGGDIMRRSLGTNTPEANGVVYCFFPVEIVDSQTISRPITFTVEVSLIYAGDQYAVYSQDEATKVEDTGNDYSWTVEYSLIVETNGGG